MKKRQVKYFSQHNKKTISVTLVKAGWFWKTYLKLAGYGAITLPFRKVVLMDHYWRDHKLITHELGHVEQYERIGNIKFPFVYVFMLMRHGYENHPMEIEARKYERNTNYDNLKNMYSLIK